MRSKTTLVFALLSSLSATLEKPSAQVERHMLVVDLGRLRAPEELRSGRLPRAPGASGDSFGPEIAFVGADLETTSPWLAPAQVEEAIRRHVAEESWSNRRNEIKIDEEGRLIVVQTAEVLRHIERFLDRLEARCSRLTAVELVLVPPAALDEASPGWDQPGAPPWLDAAVADKALKSAGRRGTLLSAVTPDGMWKRLRPRSSSRRLVEYEIYCTGVIPVVAPSIETNVYGAFGEVLVLPAPDRTWCRVDVRMGEARTDEKPERRSLVYGELDLLHRADSRVGTSVVLPFGKVALLGSFRESGVVSAVRHGTRSPRSFVGLLRVRKLGRELAPARGKGLPVALDASLLLEPRPEFAASTLGFVDAPPENVPLVFGIEEERQSASLGPDGLVHALRQAIPATTRDAARLSVLGGTVFADTAVDAVARRLDELARHHAQLFTIDLWQVSVSEEELARAGAGGSRLDPAWLLSVAANPKCRARLAGLGGCDLTLSSVAGRDYIAGVDHVSGGTGFLIIEVGDPVIQTAFGGFVLTARADAVPGTQWVELRVRGASAEPPRFERQTRSRSTQALNVTNGEAQKNAAAPGRRGIPVDLPEQESTHWENVVTVAPGEPVLLRALPDTARPGRTLVLVAAAQTFQLDGDGSYRDTKEY